jgi:hypothetical protein
LPASLESGLRPVAAPHATQAGLWQGLICRLPKPLLVVPMVAQWLFLALRYGSLSLPSAADPAITIGGLVGESKMEYFDQIDLTLRRWLARTTSIVSGKSASDEAREAMERRDLCFPLIAKPDIGWCGFGVRRIDDSSALEDYLAAYPAGETLLLQEYIDLPGEAGLFYVRWPHQPRGRIVSLTVRQPPHVMGDGSSTVRSLLERDERLSGRSGSYENLDRIPQAGETATLSTVWSHRMGGLYRNASHAITPALDKIVDAIACSMPNLHVARFDVRFAHLAGLGAGDFRIIEINGAGSEAIEFFDPDVPFFTAYRGILAKQAMVFAIAAQNRSLGFAPCGWRALARAFRRQGRLIDAYPGSN